ncbi:MAG TPA: YqiA/YcfP family alpha/beta fold hydrolase [Thermoanaerobaculia bacterium]
MASILYLHGFASSPESQKILSLRPLLAPITINAPDLNVPSFERLDFDAMVEKATQAGLPAPHAIVGSSLGAMVALGVVHRGLHAPLILIAPALGVSTQWLDRIPAGDPVLVPNYARNEEAPIHRAFFEQMAAIRLDETPPPVPVTIIMGSKDESVPPARVAAVWRSWRSSGALAKDSKFVEIPGGDHGLTAHVDVIAREIRAAISRPAML